MTSKWDVVRELKESGLPAAVRHVIRLIADEVDADTCWTTDAHPVSLGKLKKWSGWGRSTIVRALDTAEETGWLERRRPETAAALGDFETTHYRVMIGKSIEPEPKKKTKAKRSDPSARAGLGSERDEASPAGELGPERDQGSARAGLGVVPERDHPSATAGHINQPPTGVGSTHHSHQDPLLPLAPPTLDAPAAEPPKSQTKRTKKRHRRPYGDADFDAFWEVYPRRDDPKKAWGVWQTAVKSVEPEDRPALIADIIAGAKRYRDDPNRDPGFTKLATTWLNAGSWENGLLPPRGGSSGGRQPRAVPDNRSVSTAEAIETGWGRKGNHQ